MLTALNMTSLKFARSLFLLVGSAGLALAAQAQLFTAKFDGFDTGWRSPVGTNFIAANGSSTDWARWGTGTSPLGADTLNLTLADAYNPVGLSSTGTQVANLLFRNTPTSGGGLQSIGYQLNFDLSADGVLAASDLNFSLNFEFGHSDELGTDIVRRVSGVTTQTVSFGGKSYTFTLALKDPSRGFLETNGLWYGVGESTWDAANHLATSNGGSAALELRYAAVGGAATFSAVAAPAAVPEPATYGFAGVVTLVGLALSLRRRR